MNENIKILMVAFIMGIVSTVFLHMSESKPHEISFDVSHFKQLE
jgi:hypothetical protein